MSKYETVLEVKQVSNSYKGKLEKKVLKDINFKIHKGEIFGLVGESGSGKSTLANAVLGIIDYNGEILIGGKNRKDYNRRELSKQVQAVFQDPTASLNPAKKVGWLLEEPLRVHKRGSVSERIRRVDEMLELIGLDTTYKKRRINELSGGQKQRICIGIALMLEPDLLIADEATSALDVSVGAQILNLFKELNERLNTSMLFISHNLNVVYWLCDRIAVMSSGEIVECGEAQNIYYSPEHEYTQALLSSIPKLS
ncbi:ABC transporter ATP-binding protein [Scatolibacter rhodanostii]|uniref:ABC transporter ATP-binding protein n=1 Tax=Scatolibacter rhodanostii TaxID=2014781 RepID=UPI000C084C7D|nr:ATP-binding cassette domain-containing protein [Scatolibacter rhodanostii]